MVPACGGGGGEQLDRHASHCVHTCSSSAPLESPWGATPLHIPSPCALPAIFSPSNHLCNPPPRVPCPAGCSTWRARARCCRPHWPPPCRRRGRRGQWRCTGGCMPACVRVCVGGACAWVLVVAISPYEHPYPRMAPVCIKAHVKVSASISPIFQPPFHPSTHDCFRTGLAQSQPPTHPSTPPLPPAAMWRCRPSCPATATSQHTPAVSGGRHTCKCACPRVLALAFASSSAPQSSISLRLPVSSPSLSPSPSPFSPPAPPPHSPALPLAVWSTGSWLGLLTGMGFTVSEGLGGAVEGRAAAGRWRVSAAHVCSRRASAREGSTPLPPSYPPPSPQVGSTPVRRWKTDLGLYGAKGKDASLALARALFPGQQPILRCGGLHS